MAVADAERVGLDLVRASGLSAKGKQRYSWGWRVWVTYFREAGVSPLAVTVDEALKWRESQEWRPNTLKEIRKAVNFVYNTLGLASPLRQRQFRSALFGVSGTAAEYCGGNQSSLRNRLRDYLYWCQREGRMPLPGSGPQTAAFLRFVCEQYSYTSVEFASAAVSRYLEENGHPGTSQQPAVWAALAECRAIFEARGGSGSRALTEKVATRRGVVQDQWVRWCEGQSIRWERAEPADALRYLQTLEHQRTAASRVFQLSKLYSPYADPFSHESVLEWERWHRQALRDGALPEARRGAARKEVLARIRAAKAARRTVVPVGLTAAELEAVDDDVCDRYSQRTIGSYLNRWIRFEAWLDERGIPLGEVVGLHVAVFLKEYSQGRRFVTVFGMATGLAMVFDELGFQENPTLSAEVDRYLMMLQGSRKEAPAQVAPFREPHYQAIVANADRVVTRERPIEAELRRAFEPAAFGFMFDGMLRVNEAAGARWRHVSSFPDGSGRLLVPFSKTDQVGQGDFVYLSRRTMASLGRWKDTRRGLGLFASEDERIFNLGARELGIGLKKACSAAGFAGRHGSHSMRIGMAQHLAQAGFGLVLIMLAGRWKTPSMPAYYIREVKGPDSAVAGLHRIWADGRSRARVDEMGYDVLSTYDSARYAI